MPTAASSKPSLPSRLDPNLFPAPVKDKIVDMLEARAWAVAASHYTAKLARSAEIEGVQIDPAAIGGA